MINFNSQLTFVSDCTWACSLHFLSLRIDGVNASVLKAFPNVFWCECLSEGWDQNAKELCPGHGSTSNIEVVGCEFLLVSLFQWSIKGLEDVGAVGGGGKQQTSMLCSFIYLMYFTLNKWLLCKSNSTMCFCSGLHKFLSFRNSIKCFP